MAYSNYGAYVTRNGEHRPDREDCGVWNPSLTPAAPEYGVLGDGPVHVVLGRPYCIPKVFVNGRPYDWASQLGIEYDEEYDCYRELDLAESKRRLYMDAGMLYSYTYGWWKHGISFDVMGKHISFGISRRCSHRYGHLTWAKLVEDDVEWFGECGAGFGSGFTNKPFFEKWPQSKLYNGRWRKPVPCPTCKQKPKVIVSKGSAAFAQVCCQKCIRSVFTSHEQKAFERDAMVRRCIAAWNMACNGVEFEEQFLDDDVTTIQFYELGFTK